MEKIRLGMIGCGRMMKRHALAIQQVDNVDITAVCDVVLERAEDVASVLNNPYVTTDYRTVLEHVDAVLVALPHDLHYECGLYFARHKKHIMMEKPLCNTEEECVRLINACDEEGVILMCAYPVRFWPGIRKLKELVDSGEYGQVMQMSVWTEQLTQYDELHWCNTARVGGGQLFSHGCHYIDIILWFLGNPVKGTHFGTRVGTPWMLREGTSALTIKFESGAIAYHGGTWGARGTRMGYDFQIMTEKGLLEYDHHEGIVKVYDALKAHKPGEPDEGYKNFRVVWERNKEASKETQYEIKHFADCVINGEKPLTDGRTALQGLRVIWKLYEAEENNQIADLRGLGLNEWK